MTSSLATKTALVQPQIEHKIAAFYKFTPISESELEPLAQKIHQLAEDCDLRGLFLLSREGYNTTMAGLPDGIDRFMSELPELIDLAEVLVKYSSAEFQPFRRLKIDLRDEIITYRGPESSVPGATETHLSPAEWHQLLTESEDVVLIDTRNSYEVEVGKFKSAIDPDIKHFSDFHGYIADQHPDRDKTYLLYCTGGIRCEKAVIDLKREGYSNVFQLEGGILNYLKEYPEGEFEGECFVFDHRVSVDSSLAPSKRYKLCPLCGNPGDMPITCANCGTKAIICKQCLPEDPKDWACSKNCRHHLARRAAAKSR